MKAAPLCAVEPEDTDDDYDIELWDEIKAPCDCRYCRCTTLTAHGVKCSDCMNGAHQG